MLDSRFVMIEKSAVGASSDSCYTGFCEGRSVNHYQPIAPTVTLSEPFLNKTYDAQALPTV
ncbi:MAG TPA: hypothetical protein V6D50_12635 [Chroococcales cyanobacterium]|jgi:hypothetical protein